MGEWVEMEMEMVGMLRWRDRRDVGMWGCWDVDVHFGIAGKGEWELR